ncbi:MAG TPA: permease-like cell division protein FtsX [Candidatus Dormibacteraeota bacterium]
MVIKGRFPGRRRLLVVVMRNAGRYLFQGALRNWLRNLGGTAPALGSMTLLLLLSGLVGMSGFAMRNLAVSEAHDASLLHVYLRDDAADDQITALRARIEADHRVASVGYTTKAEALARAQRRPGLPELVDATDSNPFPASLDVQVKQVSDVGAIDALVRDDPAVDPGYPTSYDRGAYQRIQQVMLGAAIAGAAFLLLLGFVAVTVTANSIRSAIHARRDEVTIMQLVGAPRWMVRGPFVIEGALTGGLAGLLAGIVTLLISLALIAAGAGSFAQVAPGVTVEVAVVAALLVFAVGIALGSGSSLFSLRRHLES